MQARWGSDIAHGLSHVTVEKQFTILDVGCGGGRTVSKLAAVATEGKVYGLDFSAASIAVASKTNRDWIKTGRVEIWHSSTATAAALLPSLPEDQGLLTGTVHQQASSLSRLNSRCLLVQDDTAIVGFRKSSMAKNLN